MIIDFQETFPWWGAKSLIGEELGRYYPKGGIRTMIDCCAGSGKLAVNPPYYYPNIIYNDLDILLVNLFRVIKEDRLFPLLCQQLLKEGYSEQVFNRAKLLCNNFEGGSEEDAIYKRKALENAPRVDLAVAKFQLISLSFNALQKSYRKSCPLETTKHLARVYNLGSLHTRLNTLNIHFSNNNALELIEKSTPDTLLLLDVPYLAGKEEKRKQIGAYRQFDWPKELHECFLKTIRNTPAKALICGYHSNLYSQYLKPIKGIPHRQGEWGEIPVRMVAKSGSNKKRLHTLGRVQETIWINYPL